MKKVFFILAALVILIAGSTFLYNNLMDRAPVPSLNAAAEPEERFMAPDFTVYDIDGNNVKLSDMLGKPVVLNFWASWCPPCKEEMPDFNNVYNEAGDETIFMMVNATDGARETKDKGAAFISEGGYAFPVYYDLDLEAVNQYGIRALPTSVFIDS